MEVIFTKQDAVNATLVIKLGPVDYKASVDNVLSQYVKSASKTGFRPGKEPINFIRKTRGKNVLIETITRILANEIKNYIQNNKLNVLGEPIPDVNTFNNVNWEKQTDFEFSYKFGLSPEFELPTSLDVTNYTIAVTDSVIDDALVSIKQQFGELEDIDVAEKGDILVGDVSIDGNEIISASLLPLNKVLETALSAFIGAKVGDSITFDLQEAFGDDNNTITTFLSKNGEDSPILTGKVTFEINNVRRQGELEFNQDLFDKVLGEGVATTKEEFLAKIKEVISANYERESKNSLNKSIQAELIAKTEILLPDAFLKNWLFVANKESISKEQIEMEYSNYYAKELKWNLIQGKAAKALSIKITDEEILAQAKADISAQFGGMAIDEKMDELITNWAQTDLAANNNKKYYKTADAIVYSKVIEHYMNTLDIKQKEVTAEEYQQILKEEVAN